MVHRRTACCVGVDPKMVGGTAALESFGTLEVLKNSRPKLFRSEVRLG